MRSSRVAPEVSGPPERNTSSLPLLEQSFETPGSSDHEPSTRHNAPAQPPPLSMSPSGNRSVRFNESFVGNLQTTPSLRKAGSKIPQEEQPPVTGWRAYLPKPQAPYEELSADLCERSLFVFSKNNLIRKYIVKLIRWWAFDAFILGAILGNCVTLALSSNRPEFAQTELANNLKVRDWR